ncbi:hypothetical protein HF086_013552 [Spodoptera exigua]|uniref:polyribonucleotide nucleotidyltransferase n=1 Tax=Spodoptera exigua TaxID=7107 RepID=A0A922SMM0_SPOEX|nr:hypothetical protein HF086_013552 [Spodoptera exigua]
MLARKPLFLSRLIHKRRCSRCYTEQSGVGEVDIPFSKGTSLNIKSGQYARFADGACVATLGNTAILSTVVSRAKQSSSSFLPLVVDYRQKAAAAGRIPTNFLRRELGPTEREILTSRLIDRSLRPLFPQNYFFDTQIVCNMLAVDSTNPPETVAINAASAALALSDVPWNGPIGAVRIGQIDNEVIINPTRKDLEKSILNLVVAATNRNLVVMMEGSAQDILQQDLLKAIKLGMQKSHGKMKREYETPPPLHQDIVDAVSTLSSMKIREILSDYSHDKISRDNAISELRQMVLNQLRETEVDVTQLQDCFNANLKRIFRDMIFETDIRGIKEKSFFLHYEFPSYATGEVGRTGAPGRREAGHGALAERGLLPVVPHQPYTVRLTAEVLESNGSSSMASVCGGSLALMDAGVALSAPAAGVAIGLVSRPDEQGQIEDYRILTDLLGIEDYMGDMDFKVAGTKKGVTALQADVKVPGLPLKIVMESIQKACDAKSKIIDIMNQCIDKPRQGHKENMPVIEEMEVEVHKRPKLLGMGGANLKKLYLETGVQVTPIDDVKYSIFAPSQAAMDEAHSRIQGWLTSQKTPELEFGAIYKARVVEIMHPSVLGLDVGSEIQVKYFGRDPVSGQVRLSRKVLSSPPPGVVKKLDKA